MSTNNNNEIAFHSEESRKQAMKKFEMIRPILMEQARLSETAKETGVPIRTLQSWIQKYSKFGLKGLIRKKRSDINSYRINQSVLEEIERLALSFRSASITSIHRKVCKYCNSLNLTSPSYKQVYSVVKNMPPSLKMLAFEGKKEYQNQFDLIYSREANYPN
ncbi:MAG: helix-turn-helix domain-containing protein [Bacillota bacterium]